MSYKVILGATRPLVAPGSRLGFQEFNGNNDIKFSMDSRVLHNYRPRIQSLRYAACVEVIEVRSEYDFCGLDWGGLKDLFTTKVLRMWWDTFEMTRPRFPVGSFAPTGQVCVHRAARYDETIRGFGRSLVVTSGIKEFDDDV